MRKITGAVIVGVALVSAGWASGRTYSQYEFKVAMHDIATTPTGAPVNSFQKCLTESWREALELQTDVPPLSWRLVPETSHD